ncbi:MAG TPA: hypothetical protein VET48_11120, partial [Steroidobacteraceae bacterium]|nr:hypothetical protein [Steroidobacteraceae bacterium]
MIYRSKNRELLKRQMRPVPAPANEAPELGFGTRASIRGQRLVLQDGTFNVKRVGERSNIVGNAFHHLITMSWSKFFGMLVIAFIIANIIFAGVYYLLGVQHLQGMIG